MISKLNKKEGHIFNIDGQDFFYNVCKNELYEIDGYTTKIL